MVYSGVLQSHTVIHDSMPWSCREVVVYSCGLKCVWLQKKAKIKFASKIPKKKGPINQSRGKDKVEL